MDIGNEHHNTHIHSKEVIPDIFGNRKPLPSLLPVKSETCLDQTRITKPKMWTLLCKKKREAAGKNITAQKGLKMRVHQEKALQNCFLSVP